MDKKSALKLVLKDKDRKSLPILVKELIHCGLIEKELPFYYFTSLLYKKSAPDYRNFIGHKAVDDISKEYFNVGNIDELENKLTFGKILSKNDIHTPKILAYNKNRTLFLRNIKLDIDSIEELVSVVNSLINESSTKSIFIKPVDGIGGANSFKFTLEQTISSKMKKLFNLLDKQSFIFQETIEQDEEVNKIYSKSINTVRVHTFYDSTSNRVEILSALMRFGSHGSEVDNGSSGGFFIPVEMKTWSTKGLGLSYLKSGGKAYSAHPDSNVKLDNWSIPYGKQIEDEVIKAAKLFNKEFIGWDVAVTSSGPMIIEGNQNPHLIMLQMACGGIRNHDRYKEIFKEYI